jgi:hypothetical protein
MADETAEAQVESPAGTPAPETPDAAEQSVLSEIDKAGSGSAETEKAADENSGGSEQEQGLQVDPDLFVRAIHAGLSKDDVIAIGNDAALERTIALLESRPAPDGAPAEEKPAQEAAQQKPPEIKLPEWKPKLDDIADPIVAALNDVPTYVEGVIKAYMAHQNPEVAAMREELEGFRNHFREEQQARTDAEVDSWVAKQGPEMESVFGKGSLEDLDRNSDGFKNRSKLYDRALIEAKVAIASGKRPPPLEKLLDTAKAVLFQKQVASQERKKVLLKAKASKGVLLAKPSNRPGIPGEDEDAKEKRVLAEMQNTINKS